MGVMFSDPSAELQPALDALWRADAGVRAAFGSQTVKIYDAPPTFKPGQAPRHYIVFGLVQPLPVDGTDAANTEITWHIWSLPDPPGKSVAQTIGAATMTALLGLTDLPSHTVTSTLPTTLEYLTDPIDGVTAHGVLKAEIVTQPKP